MRSCCSGAPCSPSSPSPWPPVVLPPYPIISGGAVRSSAREIAYAACALFCQLPVVVEHAHPARPDFLIQRVANRVDAMIVGVHNVGQHATGFGVDLVAVHPRLAR